MPFSSSGEDLCINDKHFVVIDDQTYGTELFLTDGYGESTTSLMRDINPSGDSYPLYGVLLNGILLFSATDGIHGWELWRSDGTEGGTYMLKDIEDEGASEPRDLTIFNNIVYFSANTADYGRELWRTDGTDSGTYLVKDINQGAGNGSAPSDFAVYNGNLYFVAQYGTQGRDLWKTDGTEEGTTCVKDLAPAEDYSDIVNLAVVNNLLVMTHGFSPFDYLQLYVSDGTDAGTHALLDNQGRPAYTYINPGCVWNGYYFYWGSTNETTDKLWRTDGTPAGTQELSDLAPVEDTDPLFVAATDRIYFDADDPVYGTELFTSDGTVGGTHLVKELNPSGDIEIGSMTLVHDILYFTASYGSCRDLFRSDGTEAGTYLAENPGESSYARYCVQACGEVVLFDGYNGVYSWAATPEKELARNKWRMVGVPVIVNECLCGDDLFANDFDSQMPNGSNWMMSRWDAANECYIRLGETDSDGEEHGDPAEVTAGLGYWMIQDVADDTKLKICDCQVYSMCREDTEINVPVNKPSTSPAYRGLTMLANPYMYSYEVSHSYIWDGSGSVSLVQLVDAGDFNSNIYTWDPDAGASGQYVVSLIDEAILDPWEGFWFEQLDDETEYEFVFLTPFLYDQYSQPGGSPPGGQEGTRQVAESGCWTLDLPVRSVDGAYLDEYNRIGIGECCKDGFDQYDASEFNPMGNRFVQAYFDHPQWSSQAEQFTFDLRDTDFSHGPKEWDYTVRTWRLGEQTFEIEWPGISDVPTDYQFTLIDNSSGAPVELDMRSQTSIRFQTGPHTGVYELHTWTIRVEKTFVSDTPEITLLPSSYEFQSPYPNPFNPTSMLTIALPEAGNLKVQVFNMLGQQVATLADGQYNAGYQKLVLDGGSLASGTYLVRAEVPGKLDISRKVQLIK